LDPDPHTVSKYGSETPDKLKDKRERGKCARKRREDEGK
jgi:hypothetical protein